MSWRAGYKVVLLMTISLPGADAEATRSALVAALKAAGFRRVDKDAPPQDHFTTG